MKLLVIRFGSLGDLVLMTPLLKALCEGFPDGELHLACKEQYGSLFAHGSCIDRVITLSGGGTTELFELRSRLAKERYDVIIDAHNVLRSNLIYHSLRAPQKIQIRKDHLKKYLLIKRKKNVFKRPVPRTEAYLDLARSLGLAPHDSSTELKIPDYASLASREMIGKAGFGQKNLAAVAPGTRWETKRWPETYYARLIGRLTANGIGTVIVGGMDETDLCARIARKSASRPLDLTGKLSIIETAAVLRECSVLVTNDSAPLHIAEAVGTPVVAIFGPTVKEFGYFPGLEASIALEIGLACRPCSRNGSSPCPLGTKECLTAISPERVIQAVLAVIGSGSGDDKSSRETSGGRT
jgi:heptosyltransferase-2